MAGDLTETGALYSPLVGLIYVFNLIVGTGALTMPKAFAAAGWLISLLLVVVLAFMSYLTVTFMIEAMAASNAVRRLKMGDLPEDREQLAAEKERLEVDMLDETTPLVQYGPGYLSDPDIIEEKLFKISQRIEMGQMASMFFNKVGMNLFYICMAIYLYGDLAIYGAAVPKSIRDVACTYQGPLINGSHCNDTLNENDLCWENVPSISRINAYRIFLTAFAFVMVPFVFFNVQKTKYLQFFTTVMRWFSFALMITLASIRLSKGQGEGHPSIADISGIPTLFGVCVYSFMCHHSLPSLATPIRDKSKLNALFAGDYILILGFYCVLSFTGIFTFSNIQDLYTLNFQPNSCESESPITNVVFFEYFLALFPVFTLSTNFPIIAITLRNNLKTMVLDEHKEYSFFVVRILFPIVTVVPPLIIAYATNKVDVLVSITGSYAGAGIQYIVPAALVLMSRRAVTENFGPEVKNKHRSFFSHPVWVILVFVWATLCVTFVTVNYIIHGL